MGSGESGTPTKAKLSTAQDQQPSYSDWAAAFQAYCNSGGQSPHGYFPSAVASGLQLPPYMWGPQPMMPPYGVPAHPPYGAIYPHREIYGHLTNTPGSHGYGQFGLLSPGAASEGTATLAVGEEDGCKLTESANDRGPNQRPKGSLGDVALDGNKGSDTGNGNSGSVNGVFSPSSGESGSEGSSEGSEEDNSENILQKRNFEQMTLDGRGSSLAPYPSQAGGVFASPRGSVARLQPTPVGQVCGASKMSSTSSLTTNSSIGVKDYWSGSTRGSQGGQRTSASPSCVIVPTTPGTPLEVPLVRDGVPPELWLQDEREVKRQRRKQSNRESARRSRLRKQAECEELGTRVDTLTVENMALRTELTRLSQECKKLAAENTSLLGQLQKPQEDDAEVFLDRGAGGNGISLAVPSEIHGILLDMSSGSPRIQRTEAHDDGSCDSIGKLSSPNESGTCPEPVAAV